MRRATRPRLVSRTRAGGGHREIDGERAVHDAGEDALGGGGGEPARRGGAKRARGGTIERGDASDERSDAGERCARGCERTESRDGESGMMEEILERRWARRWTPRGDEHETDARGGGCVARDGG